VQLPEDARKDPRKHPRKRYAVQVMARSILPPWTCRRAERSQCRSRPLWLCLSVYLSACLSVCLSLASCGGGGGDSGGGTPSPVDPGRPTGLAGRLVSGASPVSGSCTGGRVGAVSRGAEVEPMLAVDPVAADRGVGAWQQDRDGNGGALALVSAWTADGGQTWQRTLHPMSRCGGAAPGSSGDFERATDPWVDVAPDGTVYLMGLAFSGNALAPGSSSAMLVSRSTDGGRSWAGPTVLQRDGADFFNDKNTLTVDPTDAHFVYAVWDRLDKAENGPTWLARSIDGGMQWEPARAIVVPRVEGGVAQTLGNRIVVLTDGPERGLLVNAFVQIDSVGTRVTARVRVSRSEDHGSTWSEPITVADQLAVGTVDPETGATVRDGALVLTAVAGPGGQLWLAWQDARFSGGAHDAIALARSSDGGRSWTAPVAVNRDPAVAAFTPTLSVRADGTVGLMHFDLRSNTRDTGSLLADLWLLSSLDGVTWTETALARAVDLNVAPRAGGSPFLGDYQGLAATVDAFLPFVSLPGTGASNRSDVFALSPTAASAAAAHAASPSRASHRARAPAAGGTDPPAAAERAARLEQQRRGAVRQALDARLPGRRANPPAPPRPR
jgi:hypothetical protein